MKIRNSKLNFLQKNKILSDIISLEKKDILANQTQLVNVNKNGFYLRFKKDQILVKEENFLKKFLNHYVEIFLSEYELKAEGIIKHLSLIDKNLFEVHIAFTESTPTFYRECVSDLMS